MSDISYKFSCASPSKVDVLIYIKIVPLISKCIHEPPTNVGLQWEVNSLRMDNENLRCQIDDMKESLRWIEGEYSKVNDALIQRALPNPKPKNIFKRLKFWGKD